MTRTRANPALPALLALVAVGACGGPLFSAEVVVDRFCFTQRLTGLPQLPPIQTTVAAPSPPVAVPLQLPPGLRTHASTAVLRLEDGSVTSTTPGAFLDGVASLELLVHPPSGGAVTAARYAKPPGASSLTALPLSGQGVDVADLLQSGAMQLSFAVATTGQAAPATAWDADLQLCFYGKTVISYF